MEIVGYVSKAGKLGAYKKLSEVPDKYKEGNTRVHLSAIDGSFDFWVDKDKITSPPMSNKAKYSSSCNCGEGGCCVPRCFCEYYCNCRGGNVYDC